MKVPLNEIKTFKFKEFTYAYLKSFLDTQSNTDVDTIAYFFKMSPKTFFEKSQKAGYFNNFFLEKFKEKYGKPWVSEYGYIDIDLIYKEISLLLKEKGLANLKPGLVFKYIIADIITENEDLQEPFLEFCEDKADIYFEREIYDISPIEEDYRRLKEDVLKEISITNIEIDELQELFEAAYSLVTDETELEIIKKIETHINK